MSTWRSARQGIGRAATIVTVLSADPMPSVALAHESDFEDFVVAMFQGVPYSKGRPWGLSRYDLENIKAIVSDLRAMFGVTNRQALYQPGWQQLPNTASIMDHLKNRDYEAAWDFIEIESGFLPA